jgi:hypothetical protein
VKNLNKSEAIPKYMLLVSYPGKKDAFNICLKLEWWLVFSTFFLLLDKVIGF